MRFEGLGAFVAIAETGSISRAAQRLGLATSVVSQRLAKLEQSIGVALVQRTTRKLTLTEDGQVFATRAAGIMRDAEAAAAELAERRGGLAGPLRLSAPLSFGVMHLGPALHAFLREHERVALSLDLDDRFVDVAGDGYDAVVRIGQVADNRLVSVPLAPSRRVLVAAPSYLDRKGLPTFIQDLPQHDGLSYSLRGGEDWRLHHDGRIVIVRPTIRLRVNNGDMLRDAAKAGLGLALLPTFLIGEALAAGELVALEIGAEAETDTVQLVYSKRPGTTSKVTALAAYLRAKFGAPPYWDQ